MSPDDRAKKLAAREQRTHAAMISVYGKCADTLRRLFLPVGDPDRHPDADKTWSECSMQTRSALHLAKTQKDNPQADVKELFGIIIVQGRSKNALDWEKQAGAVDEEQKRKAIEAIGTSKEPGK